MKKIEVKQDPDYEVSFEVMAESIERIGKALEAVKKTKASRKMIIALIQDDCKLGKGIIETVLNSYDQLAKTYLKQEMKK